MKKNGCHSPVCTALWIPRGTPKKSPSPLPDIQAFTSSFPTLPLLADLPTPFTSPQANTLHPNFSQDELCVVPQIPLPSYISLSIAAPTALSLLLSLIHS